MDFSDTAFGGGIVIQTGGNWLVNLVLRGFAQPYSGSLTNPTMLIGNFDLTTASCPGCPATELGSAFSLNVVTPEPSILPMLSIGILG